MQRDVRRLPKRLTVPVVGVTFRANDYPRNVHLLGDILAHLDQAVDDPSVLQFFHRKNFRPIMDECLRHGRVPIVLQRDHENAVSRHAVRVRVPILETLFLGYVPETGYGQIAVPLSAELDDDVAWHGWVHRVRINWEYPDRPGIDVTLVRGEPEVAVARICDTQPDFEYLELRPSSLPLSIDAGEDW